MTDSLKLAFDRHLGDPGQVLGLGLIQDHASSISVLLGSDYQLEQIGQGGEGRPNDQDAKKISQARALIVGSVQAGQIDGLLGSLGNNSSCIFIALEQNKEVLDKSRELVDTVNAWHSETDSLQVTELTRKVGSINHYPGIVVVEIRKVDQPLAIESGKRTVPTDWRNVFAQFWRLDAVRKLTKMLGKK